jgi:anti-sigma B factor antagonist
MWLAGEDGIPARAAVSGASEKNRAGSSFVRGAFMHRIERDFMSDLTELAALRQLVGESCAREWGDKSSLEAVDQVLLAVQEAATNIVRHAYRKTANGAIHAEIEADSERVRIWLWHQGTDFDPATVSPPSFDGSRMGGFGQHLIRQCMDEVRYIHNDHGRHGLFMARGRAPTRPTGDKMNLLVEQFDNVAVATVTAEQLDASNASDFKREMEPVLRDFTRVVLDLGRVQFVDSRGCGMILSCLKNLTERKGDLKICNVTRPVRTVFDLVRLHRICDILDTKEQAVAAFHKASAPPAS